MKYQRLTKEQLEELHQEFATFLATQSITSDEWEHIKEKQPEVAEGELDVFSDLIWEGALNNTKYLQNVSPNQLFLFKVADDGLNLIMIKISDTGIDVTSEKGFEWLKSNIKNDSVEIFTATKAYSADKNHDLFTLIQQGAQISQGTLYETFSQLIG